MKKILLLLLSVAVSGQFAYSRDVLHTENTTIVLDAEVGKGLQIVYYGARLSDTDVENLRFAGVRPQRAYPAHGLIGKEEEALSVVFPDGNVTLDGKMVKCWRLPVGTLFTLSWSKLFTRHIVVRI